jgi:peptide/nickel transport system substrate-binding protein
MLAIQGTKDETAAQIIQGQLIQMGVNATVSALDNASWMAAYLSGQYNGSVRSGAASSMDADGMYALHHSSAMRLFSFDPGWFSPEMDKLLEAGRVETNAETRKRIYTQAVNINTEEAFVIPTYYDLNVVGYNRNLKGVIPRSLWGLVYFNDWSWQ